MKKMVCFNRVLKIWLGRVITDASVINYLFCPFCLVPVQHLESVDYLLKLCRKMGSTSYYCMKKQHLTIVTESRVADTFWVFVV